MKIGWNDSIAVWWSYTWRAVLYGVLGGFVWGAVAGAIAGVTGHLDQAAQWGRIAGLVAGLTLSTLALKQALEQHLARLTAVAHTAGTQVVP